MCAEFCAAEQKANLVNLDQILDVEDFQDSDHYTRAGYYKVAKYVNDFMEDVQASEPVAMVGSG